MRHLISGLLVGLSMTMTIIGGTMIGGTMIGGTMIGGTMIGGTMIGEAVGQENRISIRGSNLDIPRFVTLKTGLVNMRTGPGKNYPIKWQYQRRHLPMKVIGEFDVWRKVVDHEGITGWMHVSTLSVKRMALITDTTVKIHVRDDPASRVRAVAEQGALGEIENCRSGWCKITAENITGWVRRPAIWGLLEGESFSQP